MTLLKTLADDFCKACTACGACAAMCPALTATGPKETPSAIQDQVRAFLEGGPPTDTVIDRAQLCNECYQCTVDTCPVGLDPMRTNLLLRGCLRKQGAWPQGDFIPPSDPAGDERVLAALLTTEEEFRRITVPSKKGDGRFLFFPGCNIYGMPDKLLTAMDIMDRLTDNWRFLPGLANCCGGNHSTAGDLEAELMAMDGLVDAFHELIGGSLRPVVSDIFFYAMVRALAGAFRSARCRLTSALTDRSGLFRAVKHGGFRRNCCQSSLSITWPRY